MYIYIHVYYIYLSPLISISSSGTVLLTEGRSEASISSLSPSSSESSVILNFKVSLLSNISGMWTIINNCIKICLI